jgi:hypothetical protein
MGEIKQQRYNYSKRNATAVRRMKKHIHGIADRRQSLNTRRTTSIIQNITFHQKKQLSHSQQKNILTFSLLIHDVNVSVMLYMQATIDD